MTPTINPIAPWPLIAVASLVILGLTLWAYRLRLRETSGGWRWVALGLRVAAVILCVLAALRPAMLVMQTIKQDVALVFLLDSSSSMGITDEANSRSRFAAARETLDQARQAVDDLGPKLQVQTYRFDSSIREFEPTETAPPDGPATAVGDALDEALKRTSGTRLLSVVLLSDGTSNDGLPPLLAAQRLKAQQVPVVAVGFGSENIGDASRDLVARDLVAGPTVFVKNQPAIRGTVGARGFPNQDVEVELYVEDQPTPVATKTVRVRDPNEVLSIQDLKWIPDRPGETRLTLKVKPKDDELVPTNNEISTYVSVQSGGLSVLYLAGPGTVWEQKFITRSLDSAQEVQVTLRMLRGPGALPDEELASGLYDVILLGDLPAEFLSPLQHRLIKQAVEQGAGLMMLGGRSSFGAGGWANTAVADVLPTSIHAGDGQIEPEGGLKVVPDFSALDNFVLRLGSSPVETQQIWENLPSIPGINELGRARDSAVILARAGEGSGPPVLVIQEVARGRSLAFAGETWPWARDILNGEASLEAHRKFWRQVILWLAHKEDDGSEEVRLALDRRRVGVSQRLDLTVRARDAEGNPMTDVQFETRVERLDAPEGEATSDPVDVFNQGEESRGFYLASGEPGEYRATVVGRRNGVEIGRDTARFLVYRDDREMENPAADFALLRQLAEMTGGQTLAPEQLGKYLGSLDAEDLTDTVVQKEVRIWDNWPFLLIFVGLLTAEWWLRKRHGWV